MAPAVAGAQQRAVAQWRFDEIAGQTAIDDGPWGLDGRLGSTPQADDEDPARIPGLNGGALHFGGGTYVRLPTAPELDSPELSVEAVVRADSSPGRFRYVVAHGAAGCLAGSYGLYTGAAGGIAFYVFDGRSYTVSATALPSDIWNGSWHHVAGVFDGATLTLYVDGHPVGSPIAAPTTIAYNLTSDDTFFGSYLGSCTLPLTGDVDLVRLWNTPLSGAAVAQLSDAALSPPSPDGSATAALPSTTATGQSDRAPLAAAADGGRLRAPTDLRAPAPSLSGAPPRACVLRPSRTRVAAQRRTTLTVSAASRGAPLTNTAIVLKRKGVRGEVARARTSSKGRASLRFTAPSRGHLVVVATGRSDCKSVVLTLAQPKAKKTKQ